MKYKKNAYRKKKHVHIQYKSTKASEQQQKSDKYAKFTWSRTPGIKLLRIASFTCME